MYSVEAHGPGLAKSRELRKELHHLRIHAAEDATPEKPAWIVSHHAAAHDKHPEEFHFSDGHEMLAHLANAANVPAGKEGEAED